LGRLIGDAIGAPVSKTLREIEAQCGWVSDFGGAGADDT